MEANEKIREARQLMKDVTKSKYFRESERARHQLGEEKVERFGKTIQNDIDSKVWSFLFFTSAFGDIFDSASRDQFMQSIQDDPPEFTVSTAEATAFDLASRSGDLFVQSVERLFQQLEGRFKSHSGFGFGEKFILTGCVSGPQGVNYYSEGLIRDLDRIFYLLDGKSPPPRYGGILGALREEIQRHGFDGVLPGTTSTDYFDLRWYKNKNLHVTVKDDTMLDKLNKVLRGDRESSLGYTPHST